jgi:hypothetical protein
MERMNRLYNENQQSINDIIIEGPGTWYPEASDINEMICSGLWDESWGLPVDDVNTIIGGDTVDRYDLECYLSSSNEPRLIMPQYSAIGEPVFEIWDPRTRQNIITTIDLSADLPSGGTQDWRPESICISQGYVYGVFRDEDAAPNYTYQVQAWQISESSTDWTVKSGWSSTGTALSGTGFYNVATEKQANIIVADANNLAINSAWVNAGAATSDAAISIVTKAAGAVTSGCGDCPNDSVNSQHLASDGTNIFWNGIGATGAYVCTATIADPTTGTGGTGYPLTIAASGTSNHRIVSCGPNMIVSIGGDSTPITTEVAVRTHNAATASLDTITLGQDSQATPVVSDKYLLGTIRDIKFDGQNIWALSHCNIDSVGQVVAMKINASTLNLRASTSSRQLPDVVSGHHIFATTTGTTLTNSRFSSMAFDSRDVWVLPVAKSIGGVSGKIYRLPRAFLKN